jgi:hypothetical protein
MSSISVKAYGAFRQTREIVETQLWKALQALAGVVIGGEELMLFPALR